VRLPLLLLHEAQRKHSGDGYDGDGAVDHEDLARGEGVESRGEEVQDRRSAGTDQIDFNV